MGNFLDNLFKKKWIDTEKFFDPYINHVWILKSNKTLTSEQHFKWLSEIVEEWKELRKKLKNDNC